MFETTQRSRAATTAFSLALLAVLLIVAAPLGYRYGLWDHTTALLRVTPAGVIFALIAFILALIGMVRTRPSTRLTGGLKAFIALLVGGAIVGFFAYQAYLGKTYPYHDVTTDMLNPPSLQLVENADGRLNSVVYDRRLSEQQIKHYPFIQPLVVTGTVADVQAIAIDLVKQSGWQLVADGVNDRTIIASETSALYEFTDDVAIRFTDLNNGRVQVDMRSNSRVGESDLRKNAERIQAFLNELEKRVATAS